MMSNRVMEPGRQILPSSRSTNPSRCLTASLRSWTPFPPLSNLLYETSSRCSDAQTAMAGANTAAPSGSSLLLLKLSCAQEGSKDRHVYDMSEEHWTLRAHTGVG